MVDNISAPFDQTSTFFGLSCCNNLLAQILSCVPNVMQIFNIWEPILYNKKFEIN